MKTNVTKSEPRFRNRFSPPVTVSLTFDTEAGRSLTKQNHKDECDINQIMKRAERSGLADFVNKHAPQYGDVSGADFRESMELIAEAQGMFDEMPSKLRDRFGNSPANFLEFVQDPKNREEAVNLGLIDDMREPDDIPRSRRRSDAAKAAKDKAEPKGED